MILEVMVCLAIVVVWYMGLFGEELIQESNWGKRYSGFLTVLIISLGAFGAVGSFFIKWPPLIAWWALFGG